MSFLLGFFLEATLGMIGFWFLEVNSLLFVYMLLNFFFSGHMFPLDMLPGVWGTLVKQIPLQYLAYFPAAVFLGKVTGAGVVLGPVRRNLAWLVFFIIVSRITFRLGTRHYSGYGRMSENSVAELYAVPMTNYLRVFLTFARNSLVRDMTFRTNFLIDTVTSVSWVLINLGFYVLIFHYTPAIGAGTGWGKYQFFLFLATGLLINSLVQALFMTNADEFSELVRTGNLDFALLKPIDTQFLVSLTRIEWSSLGNFVVGLGLMGYSLCELDYMPGPCSSCSIRSTWPAAWPFTTA